MNRDPRAHIRHGALPSIAPALLRYFQASTQTRKTATGEVMAPLLSAAADEHLKFAEEAGASALLRSGGWIKAYRSARGRDLAHGEAEELKRFGVKPILLDRAGLTALEPHVGEKAIGGVHFADPLTTSDPGALIQSYAALFVQPRRADGAGRRAEPRTFGRGLDGHDRFGAPRRPRRRHCARAVVRRARAALRPPPAVLRKARLSHALRGQGNAGLTRPVLDLERGYLVTPMARGLRLTTGAEFARRDDPPSSAHLDRLEPYARELFPIGARKDPAPWMGRRPCLPDMRPVIGPFLGQPGLWLDSGHHHLGLPSDRSQVGCWPTS